MRANIVIWWLLTAFFFFCAVLYIGWGLLYWNRIEWVGSTALVFTGFMGAMIAFFMQLIYRSQGGRELPEDEPLADIADGQVEQGEFSPWSWWPLVLASAIAVSVVALATAHFLFPLAGGLLVVGLVGWVYEYYRGNFAR